MSFEEKRDRLLTAVTTFVDAVDKPWQPIETAPKDGTRVDLWVATMDGHSQIRKPNCVFKNDEWKSENYIHTEKVYSTPLFWMPIPEPPN